MAEMVVTPSGPDALEVGLMLDEHGTRYVVLTFKEPDADPVIVTFLVPLFQSYLSILNRAGEAAGDERNWLVGSSPTDRSTVDKESTMADRNNPTQAEVEAEKNRSEIEGMDNTRSAARGNVHSETDDTPGDQDAPPPLPH